MKSVLVSILILFSTHLLGQCYLDTLTVGHDTTLCQGQSIQLSASSAYISYQWNTGATTSSIQVNSTGQYICTATIVDSLNMVLNGDFSIGNYLFTSNYIYGTGGTWGLLSNEGQYAISTNASLTHNNFASCNDHTSGTGNYMIINGSSIPNQHVWCQTVYIQPSTDYIFSAWFTSVISSNPAQLNFTINGTSIGPVVNVNSTTCQWQNFFQTWTSGATQTTANICITNQNTSTSGNDFGIDDIYFAQVCQFKDTVDVEVVDYPNFTLGNDTSLCTGDSLALWVQADSISTYLWHDSSSTQGYTSYQSETIWLEVANKHCSSTDSLILSVYDYPIVDLGSDTLICDGQAYTLDATWPPTTYTWQDGSTNPTHTASTTGIYWVELDNHGCKASDTVDIRISNGPNPDLGPDQAFCENDSVTLNPGTWDSYTWNTGSVQPSITVSPANDQGYSVTVWDPEGCSDSTDITLSPIAIPVPEIVSAADTLCLGSSTQLEAFGGDAYLWSTGTSSSLINVTPSLSQTYSVTATNSINGVDCIADTSFFLFVEDCNTLFMPSAFTPNKDGLNDLFGPEGEFALDSYELLIYDRHGKLMFRTTDVHEKWKGEDKDGAEIPMGVYVYVVNVKEPFGEAYTLSGTVHLIR